MPIDRDAALRTAERLLRQGKLDGAIEQYVRLVEDQPRDWNAINALGDLYVRAGDMDRAVAQYVRIGDFLYSEGFLPKAVALYKKALKVRPEHEHTLFRLSEIAAQQGLLADAKLYLRQLAQQRRTRGDEKGAAQCIVRIGTLDDGDGDAKMAAARAAQGIGDTAQAVALLQEAAAAYDKQQRDAPALDARIAAAELAPDDQHLRAAVARALLAAGQVERAQPFLTAEAAGQDPDLLLAIGRSDLLAGRIEAAHVVLMRAVVLAPDRQDRISQLADELLQAGRVEEAYGCVEILVDAALFEAEFARAVTLLESFLGRTRLAAPLLKLIDVCVDAGFDDRMTALQGRLADAYLDEGRLGEARLIAEDLIAREPGVEPHIERLRRALAAQGVDNAEDVIAQLRAAPIFDEPLDLLASDLSDPEPRAAHATETETVAADIPATPERATDARAEVVLPAPSAEEPPAPEVTAGIPESFEIDLSDTLAGLMSGPPVAPPLPAAVAPGPQGATNGGEVRTADLEAIFEQFRTRAGGDDQAAEAATLFERAQEHLRRGEVAEATAALQTAARVPQLRFRAAAQLGRLAASSGDLRSAVEWLERAAAAPSPRMDETFAVLYDLGDILDRSGEAARALAVFIELDGDAGGSYRDVRARIQLLTTRAAGTSPGAGREHA